MVVDGVNIIELLLTRQELMIIFVCEIKLAQNLQLSLKGLCKIDLLIKGNIF